MSSEPTDDDRTCPAAQLSHADDGSDGLAKARAAAEAEIALWAGVEAEWKTPKGDLTAYFVRESARSHREDAEMVLASIRLREAAGSPGA